MSDQLDGIAIITGAASGIGKETARLFASRGARLVLVDQNTDALDALADEPFAASICQRVVVDVASEGSAETILKACLADGEPRYLVNNAGIASSPPILDTSSDELMRFLSVNVASVFRISQAVIPSMTRSGGSIVNVSSVFGLTGVAGVSAYSLTKGAIAALTVQLATEFGRDGIRINAVAPGLIRTPLTEQRILEGSRVQQHMIDEAPLGRAGSTRDVAEAIAFLSSERASFITSEILKIDGGWMNGRLPPAPLSQ